MTATATENSALHAAQAHILPKLVQVGGRQFAVLVFLAAFGTSLAGLPAWSELPLGFRCVAALGAALAAGVNVLSATARARSSANATLKWGAMTCTATAHLTTLLIGAFMGTRTETGVTLLTL